MRSKLIFAFGTPYHLLSVTASHIAFKRNLHNLKTRCFQSVFSLPPHSIPAANAPWFLPEVGAM